MAKIDNRENFYKECDCEYCGSQKQSTKKKLNTHTLLISLFKNSDSLKVVYEEYHQSGKLLHQNNILFHFIFPNS